MPLPQNVSRREIHLRVIDMRAYARDDGLYDVEAHLVDRKPFAFQRLAAPKPVPPHQPLHDLWIRLTVDDDYVVREIEASSDTTPFGLCRQAEATLKVLIGERIARGWSAVVKERLRGAASCTHLMEMLIPLATTALQGVRGIHPERYRTVDANGVPRQVDTCYAYGRDREVVQRLWPHLGRPSPDDS